MYEHYVEAHILFNNARSIADEIASNGDGGGGGGAFGSGVAALSLLPGGERGKQTKTFL